MRPNYVLAVVACLFAATACAQRSQLTVGVALDKRGGLLVADDVGNAVWRLAPR